MLKKEWVQNIVLVLGIFVIIGIIGNIDTYCIPKNILFYIFGSLSIVSWLLFALMIGINYNGRYNPMYGILYLASCFMPASTVFVYIVEMAGFE